AILLLWGAFLAVGLFLILWIVPKLIEQCWQFFAHLQFDPEEIRRRVEPILGSYAGTTTELLVKLREKLLAVIGEHGSDWIAPIFHTLGNITASMFRL